MKGGVLAVEKFRVKQVGKLVKWQRRELRRIEKGVNKSFEMLEQWEQKKKQ
jgi:hypothetical protein